MSRLRRQLSTTLMARLEVHHGMHRYSGCPRPQPHGFQVTRFDQLEHVFPADRTEFVVDLAHVERSIAPNGLRLVE